MLSDTPPSPSIELVILPHHAVYDGRGGFANSAWLQELPDPVSRTVWGNFASISPATARRLALAERDLVEVAVGERSVRLPAVIQRGMADEVVVATLGHGRTAGGVVAVEAGGANLAPLLGRQDGGRPRVAVGVTLTKAGRAGRLAVVRTQKQRSQVGRAIALAGTLAEYRRDPAFASARQHLPPPVDTFPPYDYSKGAKWGIAIDLSACVGCGACATACQAENNIAIVGREQCDRGRQMHWMRIDRYEDGDGDDPDVQFQPMLCQQCDTAPCETVCPVRATVFGDQNDPASRLARLIRSPRSDRVLAELNTKPNVFYLARVDNPSQARREG
jgi:Fe-S-cluster-containing dehydrogenase component